ncbi:MAG: hypothetical protein D6732_18000, partial [Methanobacteriota archaeon]
ESPFEHGLIYLPITQETGYLYQTNGIKLNIYQFAEIQKTSSQQTTSQQTNNQNMKITIYITISATITITMKKFKRNQK